MMDEGVALRVATGHEAYEEVPNTHEPPHQALDENAPHVYVEKDARRAPASDWDRGAGGAQAAAGAPDAPEPESPVLRAHRALVRYSRFDALYAMIARCQRLSKLGDEPYCMSLEGATGTGKSTLVRRYERDYPRRDTIDGTLVPVFRVETPSPASVKSMAAAMLKGLRDPAWHRGTTGTLNARLIDLMDTCCVELVILDDFHHLIDTETNRVLLVVSEWLKTILKETKVPFLVIGMPGTVGRVLEADPHKQLARLFKVRKKLTGFTWNPAKPPESQDFGRFVTRLEQAIGLPLTDALGRDELLTRLHQATDGVVGHLMALIREAVLAADETGASCLELEALATGFDRGVHHFFANKVNPFAARRQPSGVVPPDTESGISRRRSHR